MNKIDFLNQVVFGYIQKDLEAIKTLPRKPNEPGNVNFPIVLCVLSYMEYLGSFFTGNSSVGAFLGNVSTYIERCFKNGDKYNAAILRDIFRNGLAHEYFARGGVARDGIEEGLYTGYKGEVILDADTLLRDFLSSLDSFRTTLSDEDFNSRMSQAETAIKKWENDYKSEIEKLPKLADMPSHVRTSGATGYPRPLEKSTTTTLPYDPNEN